MLSIAHVSKEYHTGDFTQRALDDVSLSLRDSEFVAILGPSGSGKTTLLNVIGGLDRCDSGTIVINGVSTEQYRARDWDTYRNHTIGFIFQSYSLIPHQTVLANVELALTIAGIPREERRRRAAEALERVGLSDHLQKRPAELSGGQMQRVAIARALVNDPEILLADEPTGALDSETSVQVMDLLKGIAAERLVVMVTHNQELADEYATRIVSLKDGKIVNDTDPFDPDAEAEESAAREALPSGEPAEAGAAAESGAAADMQAPASGKKRRKASMSFLTALQLSFNNLWTKRARTFLIAFAGSIGIIGIALILALSNGVNKYITQVEEETMAAYPVELDATSVDMASLMQTGAKTESAEIKLKKGEIAVTRIVSDMVSDVQSNNLKAFRKYVEKNRKKFNRYASSIEYNYAVKPLIYRDDTKTIRKVNPDETFAPLGFGSGSTRNTFVSSMMSTDSFYRLPEDESMYKGEYKVRAGRWPEKYNEIVLVLSQQGTVSDLDLYVMGLLDASDLDQAVRDFANGSPVSLKPGRKIYTYNDFLGATFRIVNASDCYTYDETLNIWKDRSDDTEFMRSVVEKAEKLKIVGIVQPKKGAAVTFSPGFWYTTELKTHLIRYAKGSSVVKAQLAKPDINIFTGKPFGEQEGLEDTFDLRNIITVDEAAFRSAFKFNASKIHISSSELAADMSDIDWNSLVKSASSHISAEGVQQLTAALQAGYANYAAAHGLPQLNEFTDPQEAQAAMAQYLQSAEAQQILAENLADAVDTDAIRKDLSARISTELQRTLRRALPKYQARLMNAVSVDTGALARAFRFNMDEDELMEGLAQMMSGGEATLDSNLKSLGYAELGRPDQILIYPKGFEDKDHVTKLIDQYNRRMKKKGRDEDVIAYTDLVGSMMASVTKIVNAISYVLIAFVSISLVVSSIMIGVITYISVLERRKEIGVLRALGASKLNVSNVFNAETFLIGLLAGLLGIGISLALTVPLNQIIDHVTKNLPIQGYLEIRQALFLIALSVVLTLIGGLIPSLKAAKSDPVAALRTE